MTAEPILRISGLEKSFRIHALGRVIPALRGVHLHVSHGEHVVVAGPSGSGKSSLLRCVYRTYLAGAGSIHYQPEGGESVDLAFLPDAAVADLRQRDIGYVPQFLRAEPRRTAFEVVSIAARRRGMTGARVETAARSALDEVGLVADLWDGLPALMSGGEQQRVNIAAATVAPPRLLLLDEPVSALDSANREMVMKRIESLRTAGVSILSVFHDWEAIARLAERVVVLHAGRVTAEGTAAEVKAGQWRQPRD